MDTSRRSHSCRSAVVCVALALSFAFCLPSEAQSPPLSQTRELEKIELAVGKTVLLRSPRSVANLHISVGNPEVADVSFYPPQEIYVAAKAPGTTNLTVWQAGEILATYDINVSIDIARLKEKLNQLLPDESDLRVVATSDSITLSGRVSSASNLSQALALADAYAPKGKVYNLVQVAGVHQVMLEVRVSEMDRRLTKRLGINWVYNENGNFGVGLMGQLATLVKPQDAQLFTNPLGWNVSTTVNALFRFKDSNGGTHTGLIDALREDGLIKILAEPTLLALSGQTASFLAGGEFPVPIPQGGLGAVGIEYKSFGVRLDFTPTVLSQDKISMQVAPEVSELDFTTAVRFQGFVVPGLNTRRVSTVVELADGQSFAVAGLLRDTTRDTISKYPFLGDVPVLGNLFRSRQFQNEETELVIIVTPHLVRPLDMKQPPLPTQFYIEPDDVDFYVFGTLEGRGKAPPATEQWEMDGDFGHAIPLSE